MSRQNLRTPCRVLCDWCRAHFERGCIASMPHTDEQWNAYLARTSSNKEETGA